MYAKLTDFVEIKRSAVESRKSGAKLYIIKELAEKNNFTVFLGEYVGKERTAGLFLETPGFYMELRSGRSYNKLLEPVQREEVSREVHKALEEINLGRYEKIIKSRRDPSTLSVEASLNAFFQRNKIELRAKTLGSYIMVYNSPLRVFVIYERVKNRRYFRVFRKEKVHLMPYLGIKEEQVRKYANKVLYWRTR